MDTKLVTNLHQCLTQLVSTKKENFPPECFQDMYLYIVHDISVYQDLMELQYICPLTVPLVVGCCGRKETVAVKKESLDSVANQDKRICEDNNSIYEGQPLELKEYVDLNHIEVSPLNSPVVKKDNSSFSPVRLSYGRRLLSAYSTLMLSSNNAVKEEERIPLLMYCSGHDFKRSAFVYINPVTVDNKTTLVHNQISVGEAKDVTTITSYRLPDFMRQRTSLAEYNVFDGSRSYNNVFTERATRIILEAEWTKPVTFLEKPPPNAKVSIKAKIISGDKISPTYPKFKELFTLKGFFDGLEKGQVSWLTPESEDELVIEDLKDLFEQLKLGDARVEENYESNQNNSDIPQKSLVTDRKDQDFSDKLWNVLINCSGYEELVDCLNFMFAELRSKNIQLLVHKTNKTRIAELIRNSYTNDMCIPDLEGFIPLKLLIEIGVEKLCNDYISMLMTNELTTLDQLQFYTDRSCNLQERMDKLEKLHNVYELVTMLNFYLKVSQSTLSFATRTALAYYKTNSLDDNHTFVLPVSAACVSNFLDISQPYFWKMEVENVKDSAERKTFSFFEKLPFDHIAMTEDYPDELSYYVVDLWQRSISL